MKSTSVFGLCLVLLFGAASAWAAEPVNKSYFGNVAAEGHDVVAYFTDGKPVEGDKKITFEYGGAVYRFATEKHRAMFESEPTRYLPAYGGYCAWAVAQGKTAGVDPKAWTIHDGRLFLNYNKKIQADWLKDMAGNIARADANWPAIAAGKSG